MTATPALDWLLRGGLCGHETRAACPACSRTEAARVELDALRARVARVERVLEEAGCSCDCECSWDEHDAECERCDMCRVEMALEGER